MIRYLLILVFLCFGMIGCNTKKDEKAKQEKEVVEKKEEKYIYDYSLLLKPNETKNLESLLKEISSESVEYVFCSINNEGQESIDNISEKYFNSLDVGNNNYSNRVLIIVSVMTRDFKIVLGKNINETISEGELLDINSKVISYFKESKFYEGLNFAFNELNKKLIKAV